MSVQSCDRGIFHFVRSAGDLDRPSSPNVAARGSAGSEMWHSNSHETVQRLADVRRLVSRLAISGVGRLLGMMTEGGVSPMETPRLRYQNRSIRLFQPASSAAGSSHFTRFNYSKQAGHLRTSQLRPVPTLHTHKMKSKLLPGETGCMSAESR
jgi:hypothetical protein